MFSQRRSHCWSQRSRTFFFKVFSAKQQKKPKKAANYSVIEQNALSDKHPKMTGQNDRPDESLTGQAHDQAGHCPLTGRYFEPCVLLKTPTKCREFFPTVFVKTTDFQLLFNFEQTHTITILGEHGLHGFFVLSPWSLCFVSKTKLKGLISNLLFSNFGVVHNKHVNSFFLLQAIFVDTNNCFWYNKQTIVPLRRVTKSKLLTTNWQPA